MDRHLLNYLPPVLREVLEFQIINGANEPEISLAWDAITRVLANQFLEDADEDGVAVWEQELRLFPKDTDTLEARKARIKAKWNLELPYTLRWLKNWLAGLCGPDGHSVSLQDYTLDIQLDYTVLPEADRLPTARVIPADFSQETVDRLYAKFSDAFEAQYINQGFRENRTIEQTLDLGWRLLGILPKSEMKPHGLVAPADQ